MCSLYGGILVGVGMALIFLSGSTTGGSDVVGYLMQKKYPHVSIGRALLLIDGLILSISVFVFKNVDAALFGLISLYVQTKVIDMMIYGNDAGSKVSIITRFPQEIGNRIIRELDRTATIIPCRGAFSGQESTIVLCTVRKSEFSILKRIIGETDENAFVMVTETTEVFGLGCSGIVTAVRTAGTSRAPEHFQTRAGAALYNPGINSGRRFWHSGLKWEYIFYNGRKSHMRFVYEADSAADYETSDSRGGGRTGADRDAVYDSPVRRAGGVGKQRTYRKRAAGGGSGQRTWRDFSQTQK